MELSVLASASLAIKEEHDENNETDRITYRYGRLSWEPIDTGRSRIN
jgi:hypothetical protein